MSASKENKPLQEQIDSGVMNEKELEEQEKLRQEKQAKRNSILYAVIAVVFVIVAIASVIWRSNVIPRKSTAVTIDGEKYTAAEVSFYYQNAFQAFVNNYSYFMSYMGLDANSPLESQVMTDVTTSMLGLEPGTTWKDYFLDQALTQMAAIDVTLTKAENDGFVYPAGVQAQFDDSVAMLEDAAAASGMSVEQYLNSTFSMIMTEEVYYNELMRMLQFDACSSAYQDSLTYSVDELEKVYNEDPKSFDKVDYELVTVPGSAPTTTDADGHTVTASEEEIAAAKEAAKETAEQVLSVYKTGADLKSLAEGIENATYTNNAAVSYSSGFSLSEWLFDDARKPGDVDIVESGSYYYVVVFHDRYREEYNTVDVRHILVQEETSDTADALLAQWKAGEATEASFAQLAMENSTDGSKYDGGLYTRIYEGQMVDAFNNWCFNSSRKSGDTEVVQTEYGYHVMYFVGQNLPRWQADVSAQLQSEAMNAWAQGLATDSTIEVHDFGMKFVA